MKTFNTIGLLNGVKQSVYDNVGYDGKKLDEFYITASAKSFKEMGELIDFLRIQQHCFHNPRQKLPIGIMLTKIWKENRVQELEDAISRYVQQDIPVPLGWIVEQFTLKKELKNENNQ